MSQAKVNLIEKRWSELLAQCGVSSGALALYSDEAREADAEFLMRLSPERQVEWPRITSRTRALEWTVTRELELKAKSRLGTDSFYSIAHTSGGEDVDVLIVGAPRTTGLLGVGVDLESSSRPISERVVTRLVTPAERELMSAAAATPLEVWVAKESGFKATPANTGSTLPEYHLTRISREQREEGELLSGELISPERTGALVVPFVVFSFNEFLIGLAFARNP